MNRKKYNKTANTIKILSYALVVILGVGGFILKSGLFHQPTSSFASSDNSDLPVTSFLSEREQATVTRVIDGDTFKAMVNGEEVTIRLIGIDTPESVSPKKSDNTREGVIASNYTKEQLTGKDVELERDSGDTDKYGRLLRYVYLGDKMFNETLLERGYAKTMTIKPNVKYSERFEELEKAAKKSGEGFWAA